MGQAFVHEVPKKCTRPSVQSTCYEGQVVLFVSQQTRADVSKTEVSE